MHKDFGVQGKFQTQRSALVEQAEKDLAVEDSRVVVDTLVAFVAADNQAASAGDSPEGSRIQVDSHIPEASAADNQADIHSQAGSRSPADNHIQAAFAADNQADIHNQAAFAADSQVAFAVDNQGELVADIRAASAAPVASAAVDSAVVAD